MARSFERIPAHGDAALFISLRDEAAAIAEAMALMAAGAEGRPLYGIPVAIKDNIDAEGLPTTAACPAFAYKPAKDAAAVARLRRAGAIVIGTLVPTPWISMLLGPLSETAPVLDPSPPSKRRCGASLQSDA